MRKVPDSKHKALPAPVIIVSGGAGASGMQVVNTVLAQFPGYDVPVKTFSHISGSGQLAEAVLYAEQTGGIIVHTLVDAGVRKALQHLARKRRVPAVDLMGDLVEWLQEQIGYPPLCRPGLYRSLNRRYFERIEAIEYAIDHDDGQNPQDLQGADIVLLGLSRVGKTPLSMYLAMLGWKTANVPLVSGRTTHRLDEVDQGRIIGLVIDAERLASHRRIRREKLGLDKRSDYANLKAVFDEVESVRQLFRKKGYAVIDVTDKPLETSADEVVKIIARRFGSKDDSADTCLMPGSGGARDSTGARSDKRQRQTPGRPGARTLSRPAGKKTR